MSEIKRVMKKICEKEKMNEEYIILEKIFDYLEKDDSVDVADCEKPIKNIIDSK